MVVNGLRNYTPACDCHKYKRRYCNLCGISEQEYKIMLQQREKKPSKEDLKKRVERKFGANGIVKKRTIFD